MNYQDPVNSSAPTYTAGTKTWSNAVSRSMINNSTGTIIVKEVGLNTSHWRAASGAGYIYMMERSVLSPAVDVAAGATLTVTYTISMSFSAID